MYPSSGDYIKLPFYFDLDTGWTTGFQFPAGSVMEFFLFTTAFRPFRGAN